MIDYNLNPSFIISASENTDIMYTNSRDWFATAYSSFKPIINEINDAVVPTLELIQGKTIINREVVEFDNGAIGLYVNTYATYDKGVVGAEKVVLAINYFDYDVTYEKDGKTYTIPALSAMELK
jgi:predicted ribosome-associated RNA-binding protein Tma20